MNKGEIIVASAIAVATFLHSPILMAQSASPSPYGGLLSERSTLTGDWGGARDELAARGITITPSITQFYQGATAGNASHEFKYGGKAETFININGAKLGLWDGFGIHAKGEFNFGRTPGSIGGTTIPNSVAMIIPYQNKEGGDFTSLYISQRFGSNFTLLAGKINIVDLYGAAQKFNGGRGIERFQNFALAAPPSGTLPVSMLGVIGSYKIDPFTLSLWVYDPRESLNRWISNPFSEGVSVRAIVDYASAPFGLARKDSFTFYTSSYPGTDFSTLPDLGQFASTPELRGDLIKAFITRGMLGQDGWAHLPTALQQPSTSQKRGRYYFSYAFQQSLWQSSDNPANAWGMFGQVAFSDGNPNPFKWNAVVGLGGTSPLPGRSNDKFGMGFFYYSYSKELRQGLSPILTLGDEYGLEVFYNLAVTKWFKLTANVQVIEPAVKAQLVAPQTIEKNRPVVLMGLRSQTVF